MNRITDLATLPGAETGVKLTTRAQVMLVLAAILLIGGVMRFWGLDIQSLWIDELASWDMTHYDSLAAVISQGVRPDVHPPGYFMILYWAEQVLGDSETALRLPSAVAGVLSLGMIFWLGRLLYSYREGLIAAALTAVLWAPITYSQEARPYAFLMLGAIIASYFWIKLVWDLAADRRPQTSTLILYVLSAAATAYLHYFGLYLVALQGIAIPLLLAPARNRLLWWLAVYFVMLLAYIPWLPALFEDLQRTSTWIEAPTLGNFPWYFRFLFNNSAWFAYTVAIPLYLLVGWNVVREFRTRPPSQGIRAFLLTPIALLLLWVVVPIIIVFIKSTLSTPVMTNRNLIILVPPAYLLLARAFTLVPVPKNTQNALVGVFMALSVAQLVFAQGYYSKPHKAQYREAAQYIVARQEDYKNAAIVASTRSAADFDYYFEKMGSPLRVDLMAIEPDDRGKLLALSTRENLHYVWYAIGHDVPDRSLFQLLHHKGELVDDHNFYGTSVRLYKLDKGNR